MNAPSPWLRPLQAAAILLALANAVLGALWLQGGTEPPPRTGIESAANRSASESPATAAPAEATAPAASSTAPTPAAEAPTTAPAATATLFGTVLRRDGSTPTRGYVHLEGQSGVSVENGTFAFAGLAPGSHELSTRFDDELPFRATVEVRAPSTRFDVVLDKAWLLTVHAVTPEGAPLVDALRKGGLSLGPMRGLSALAFEEHVAAEVFATSGEVRAGIGTFRGPDFRATAAMPKQTVGVLTLPPGQPVHVALLLRGAVLAQTEVTPDRTEVNFELAASAVLSRLGSARLRVIDGAGAPVTNVRVALHGAGSSGGGTPVDGDGRAVLPNLQPGMLGLSIVGTPLLPRPRRVFVQPGREIDLGDVVLHATTDVDLVVEPFSQGTSVLVTCLEHESASPGPASRFGGSDGSVKLRVTPGRHGVFVNSKQGCALLEFDTAALPPQPIRVALRPGAPLRLDNRVGSGFTNVVIRSAVGTVVLDGEFTGTKGRDVSVPVGNYTATLVGSRGAAERSFTVGNDGGTLVIE